MLRGVQEITPLFQDLFAEFAKPGATFDLRQQMIEGNVAYIWWVAETPITRTSSGPIRFSCGTARSRCRPSRSKRRPGPDVREVNDGLTLSLDPRASRPVPVQAPTVKRCTHCSIAFLPRSDRSSERLPSPNMR